MPKITDCIDFVPQFLSYRETLFYIDTVFHKLLSLSALKKRMPLRPKFLEIGRTRIGKLMPSKKRVSQIEEKPEWMQPATET